MGGDKDLTPPPSPNPDVTCEENGDYSGNYWHMAPVSENVIYIQGRQSLRCGSKLTDVWQMNGEGGEGEGGTNEDNSDGGPAV